MLLVKVAPDFPRDLLSEPAHVACVGVKADKSKHSLYSNRALFSACIPGAKVLWNHYQLIYVEKPSIKYSQGNMI